MRVVYHESARADPESAATYYERCERALGDAFPDEFETLITHVAEMPMRWPKVTEERRRVRLRRFFYIMIYRLMSDRIRVLVVKHARRHEGFGFERT